MLKIYALHICCTPLVSFLLVRTINWLNISVKSIIILHQSRKRSRFICQKSTHRHSKTKSSNSMSETTPCLKRSQNSGFPKALCSHGKNNMMMRISSSFPRQVKEKTSGTSPLEENGWDAGGFRTQFLRHLRFNRWENGGHRAAGGAIFRSCSLRSPKAAARHLL